MSASTALREAIITRLKADAGVRATAMGASPRVHNIAPPGLAFPFVLVKVDARNDDTHSERGGEHEVKLFVEGEFEGEEQGEAIFRATLESLRSWARPAALSGHVLANLVFTSEAVVSAEDGKRYAGLQTWRAVTEET